MTAPGDLLIAAFRSRRTIIRDRTAVSDIVTAVARDPDEAEVLRTAFEEVSRRPH